MNLQATGANGESIAAQLLLDKGFTIIARNYRTRFGELDIIAKKDEKIHFVEVKTRNSLRHGKPYEAITFYKTKHLMRASTLFLLQNGYKGSKLSLDVISILLENGTPKHIEHYENITL